MPAYHPLLTVVGVAALGVAAGYGLLAVTAVLVWRLRCKLDAAPPTAPAPEARRPVKWG